MNKNAINKICRKFGFEVHGTGYIQSVKKNSFKEDAFDKQAELLHSGVNTIFDIGANFGDTVSKYSELFPKASIYAFEPFPSTYDGLAQRMKNNSKISAFQLAVSDHNGKSVFYVNHNVDTNSLFPSQKMGLSSDEQVKPKTTIDVDLITIDSFCTQHNITRIDVLKMDIQGGELAALKGAEKMLQQKKIKLIYTEAFFREQYVNQPLFHDIAKYLRENDYYLQDVYNSFYGKGSIAWCDAIFLPFT